MGIRKQVIRSAFNAGEGHIASALSILDILHVLYKDVLDLDEAASSDNDRFILSKGHASLGLYAVLADAGILPSSELDGFGRYNSILGGHPDRNKVPGVEASTGSLGHGLPMAVGMAMGFKIQKKNSRVFVLVGDGELNEGSLWESIMLAAHHRLDNLCCIVDYNHSTDRALGLGNIAGKFTAFDWDVLEVDGHDQQAIQDALRWDAQQKPHAVIAHTIKGKGIREMENNPAWHHKAPTAEELKRFLEELS